MKATITIVSGTPGTGKTTIAKRLAKKNKATYIDVNVLITKHKLSDGYDRKRKAKIIDVKKLNKVLIGMIKQARKEKQSLFIDSHLSHYLDPKWVDKCLITKTTLSKLKRRLKKRGYAQDKITENLQCEIFDVCFVEAKEAGHNVEIVET